MHPDPGALIKSSRIPGKVVADEVDHLGVEFNRVDPRHVVIERLLNLGPAAGAQHQHMFRLPQVVGQGRGVPVQVRQPLLRRPIVVIAVMLSASVNRPSCGYRGIGGTG